MLFVDFSLALRLEMVQAWRGVEYSQVQQARYPESGGRIEAIAGGYALFSGARFPVNRAIGLGFETPITGAEVDQVETFYRACGLLPRIDLCPLADSSLLNILRLRGYQLERFYSVLVYPLPEEIDTVPLPPGVEIAQARPEEADLWLKTVAQGFSEEEEPSQETLDILVPNFYSPSTTSFFARVGDQPAGGGAMFSYGGVVEFGGASTRPIFRRRGIQTALLRARLAVARAQGCDVAIVVTTPGTESQHNVERVGFYLAYTKAVMIKENDE
jgi:GNAT superfamily N-acetyltransferase